MSATIVIRITDIPPFDGDHELDIEGSPLTNRELHTIKRLSGLRPAEFEEALENLDTSLVVALAAVALQRNGVHVPRQGEDALWDAPSGKIVLDASQEEAEAEADAGPPYIPQPQPEPPANGDVSATSSGVASSNGSDGQENDPSRIGGQGSASSVSGHAI